jgi:hypothetical protein
VGFVITTRERPREKPPTATRRRLLRHAPLAAGALLLAVTLVAGHLMRDRGGLPIDAVPPFHTIPRLLVLPMWPAVAYGALMVVVLPRLARARWRRALPLAWVAAIGWAVSLAATDGVSRIWTTLTTKYDYLAGLPAVGADPLRWLRGFATHLSAYPEHVKGHPPLPVLVIWALDHIGLHGPVPEAALVIAAGCAAVPAVAVTVRLMSGANAARRALPFLVLSPMAMFVATSMDALFLGVTAWSVALIALAAHRGTRAPRTAALAGGLLLGAAPYLSYALLTIGALVVVVLVSARTSWRMIGWAAAGALIVPAAMTAGGFWWPDGVFATSGAWAASAGGNRPYAYFLFGDLAVLAACLGPAVLAGLGRLRGARAWALPAAALTAVVVLDLVGITRGEVERIWLPYAAWMVTATTALRPPARGWLAAQAATALVMQATLGSPW